MKNIILFILLCICSISIHAQESLKNSITASIMRLEKNSQTIHNNLNFKFMTGIGYQRHFNRWSVGIKYEHGYNKIEDTNRRGQCSDCYVGTGNIKEDNIYLTSNYSAIDLFNSRLKLNIGMSIYYSYLNYSGDFGGGFAGGIWRENKTYNTFGFAPNISIVYYPIEYLFISIDATYRVGWSKTYNSPSNQHSSGNEFVLTAPELKIGVRF